MEEAIIKLIKTVLIFTITALLLCHLWNWLIPVIFKLPTITYWQSLALLAISNILFKNFDNDKTGNQE